MLAAVYATVARNASPVCALHRFCRQKGDWGSQSWGNPDLEYLIIDPSMARARPARNGGSEDDRAFVRGVSIAVAALGNRSAPS
jgi:hypothetical protein